MPGMRKTAKTTGSMRAGSDEREGAKKRPFFLYILAIDKQIIIWYNKDTKERDNPLIERKMDYAEIHH